MSRRVFTAIVATWLPLTALSVAWLGGPASVRPGLSIAHGNGQTLVAATTEPQTCASPPDDVRRLCDDAHVDHAEDRDAPASPVRQRPAAQRRASAPEQEAAPQPSPVGTPQPDPQAEQNDDGQNTADASSETRRLRFTYGVDRMSWYWDRQRDEEVAAGPVAQRARLPNPQSPDTLPVAVESGEQSKQSAIRFDLVGHGVPAGSTVSRFVLTIAEGTDPGEAPTLNPNDRRVQACAAGSFWPSGEAEMWDTRPEAQDQCVQGTRRADGTEATWTFDLSKMAAPWGEEPFANNGVLLSGVTPSGAGASETWQVNLKAPSRDDPVTPTNEYEDTSGRVVAEVSYVPGAPGTAPVGSSGAAELTGTVGGGTTAGGGLSGGASDPVVATGVADRSGSDPNPQLPTVAAAPPFVPRVPPYVWALIPAALLATAAVRAALFENVSVTRPGGVIETIRGRNAAQRGAALPARRGPLVRLLALLPISQVGR